MQKSAAVASCAEDLYRQLQAAGVAVLLDDRNERPGVKFADMELIGIAHRVVIGDRALAEGNLEYKNRRAQESQDVPQDDIVEFLLQQLT
jgi:prolyl-tRNA synthetase